MPLQFDRRLIILIHIFVVMTINILFSPSQAFRGTPSSVWYQQKSEDARQRFAVKPLDMLAKFGQDVLLPCVLDNGNVVRKVQWRKNSIFLGFDRIIPSFPTYRMVGRDDQGNYSLAIYNVTVEDEGIYECQVLPLKGVKGSGLRAKARLIVSVLPNKGPTLSVYLNDNYHKNPILSIDLTRSISTGTYRDILLQRSESIGYHDVNDARVPIVRYVNVTTRDTLSIRCAVWGGHPPSSITWFKRGPRGVIVRLIKNTSATHFAATKSDDTGVVQNPGDDSTRYHEDNIVFNDIVLKRPLKANNAFQAAAYGGRSQLSESHRIPAIGSSTLMNDDDLMASASFRPGSKEYYEATLRYTEEEEVGVTDGPPEPHDDNTRHPSRAPSTYTCVVNHPGYPLQLYPPLSVVVNVQEAPLKVEIIVTAGGMMGDGTSPNLSRIDYDRLTQPTKNYRDIMSVAALLEGGSGATKEYWAETFSPYTGNTMNPERSYLLTGRDATLNRSLYKQELSQVKILIVCRSYGGNPIPTVQLLRDGETYSPTEKTELLIDSHLRRDGNILNHAYLVRIPSGDTNQFLPTSTVFTCKSINEIDRTGKMSKPIRIFLSTGKAQINRIKLIEGRPYRNETMTIQCASEPGFPPAIIKWKIVGTHEEHLKPILKEIPLHDLAGVIQSKMVYLGNSRGTLLSKLWSSSNMTDIYITTTTKQHHEKFVTISTIKIGPLDLILPIYLRYTTLIVSCTSNNPYDPIQESEKNLTIPIIDFPEKITVAVINPTFNASYLLHNTTVMLRCYCKDPRNVSTLYWEVFGMPYKVPIKYGVHDDTQSIELNFIANVTLNEIYSYPRDHFYMKCIQHHTLLNTTLAVLGYRPRIVDNEMSIKINPNLVESKLYGTDTVRENDRTPEKWPSLKCQVNSTDPEPTIIWYVEGGAVTLPLNGTRIITTKISNNDDSRKEDIYTLTVSILKIKLERIHDGKRIICQAINSITKSTVSAGSLVKILKSPEFENSQLGSSSLLGREGTTEIREKITLGYGISRQKLIGLKNLGYPEAIKEFGCYKEESNGILSNSGFKLSFDNLTKSIMIYEGGVIRHGKTCCKNLSKAAAGDYFKCFVSNGRGGNAWTKLEIVQIHPIQLIPRKMATNYTFVPLPSGQLVTLTCDLRRHNSEDDCGTPLPCIRSNHTRWIFKPYDGLLASDEVVRVIQDPISSDKNFEMITEVDRMILRLKRKAITGDWWLRYAGMYYCQYSDIFGQQTSPPIHVYLDSPPILIVPNIMRVRQSSTNNSESDNLNGLLFKIPIQMLINNHDNNVELPCVIASSPNSQLEWSLNGEPINIVGDDRFEIKRVDKKTKIYKPLPFFISGENFIIRGGDERNKEFGFTLPKILNEIKNITCSAKNRLGMIAVTYVLVNNTEIIEDLIKDIRVVDPDPENRKLKLQWKSRSFPSYLGNQQHSDIKLNWSIGLMPIIPHDTNNSSNLKIIPKNNGGNDEEPNISNSLSSWTRNYLGGNHKRRSDVMGGNYHTRNMKNSLEEMPDQIPLDRFKWFPLEETPLHDSFEPRIRVSTPGNENSLELLNREIDKFFDQKHHPRNSDNQKEINREVIVKGFDIMQHDNLPSANVYVVCIMATEIHDNQPLTECRGNTVKLFKWPIRNLTTVGSFKENEGSLVSQSSLEFKNTNKKLNLYTGVPPPGYYDKQIRSMNKAGIMSLNLKDNKLSSSALIHSAAGTIAKTATQIFKPDQNNSTTAIQPMALTMISIFLAIVFVCHVSILVKWRKSRSTGLLSSTVMSPHTEGVKGTCDSPKLCSISKKSSIFNGTGNGNKWLSKPHPSVNEEIKSNRAVDTSIQSAATSSGESNSTTNPPFESFFAWYVKLWKEAARQSVNGEGKLRLLRDRKIPALEKYSTKNAKLRDDTVSYDCRATEKIVDKHPRNLEKMILSPDDFSIARKSSESNKGLENPLHQITIDPRNLAQIYDISGGSSNQSRNDKMDSPDDSYAALITKVNHRHFGLLNQNEYNWGHPKVLQHESQARTAGEGFSVHRESIMEDGKRIGCQELNGSTGSKGSGSRGSAEDNILPAYTINNGCQTFELNGLPSITRTQQYLAACQQHNNHVSLTSCNTNGDRIYHGSTLLTKDGMTQESPLSCYVDSSQFSCEDSLMKICGILPISVNQQIWQQPQKCTRNLENSSQQLYKNGAINNINNNNSNDYDEDTCLRIQESLGFEVAPNVMIIGERASNMSSSGDSGHGGSIPSPIVVQNYLNGIEPGDENSKKNETSLMLDGEEDHLRTKIRNLSITTVTHNYKGGGSWWTDNNNNNNRKMTFSTNDNDTKYAKVFNRNKNIAVEKEINYPKFITTKERLKHKIMVPNTEDRTIDDLTQARKTKSTNSLISQDNSLYGTNPTHVKHDNREYGGDDGDKDIDYYEDCRSFRRTENGNPLMSFITDNSSRIGLGAIKVSDRTRLDSPAKLKHAYLEDEKTMKTEGIPSTIAMRSNYYHYRTNNSNESSPVYHQIIKRRDSCRDLQTSDQNNNSNQLTHGKNKLGEICATPIIKNSHSVNNHLLFDQCEYEALLANHNANYGCVGEIDEDTVMPVGDYFRSSIKTMNSGIDI